ncbi:DUF2179 domain-containing protein [Candidatus Woesearchaeota archaeon]|nr:DUF2179 domain-containing protein [Candidatus Woesearchaeota archaeon]
MDLIAFMTAPAFQYGVLPVAIFLARIIDVSMGTVRVIFIARGVRFWASVIGFFEVIIWLLAIGQIMQNLTNWVCYAAYGFGFASGTFIGMAIENRLSIGKVMVRIVTRRDASELISALNDQDHRVTIVPAKGIRGSEVTIIMTVIKRIELTKVADTIRQFNPKAFYTVEDVRFVSRDILGRNGPGPLRKSASWFRLWTGKK